MAWLCIWIMNLKCLSLSVLVSRGAGSSAGAGTGAQSAQGGLSEATQAGEDSTQAVPMDAGGWDGASGRGSRGNVGTGLPADSGAEKRERADSGDELAMHDGADTIVFQSALAAAGRSGGDASAPDVSAASAAADALSKSQAKAARSKERRKQARGDWAAHQRRRRGPQHGHRRLQHGAVP